MRNGKGEPHGRHWIGKPRTLIHYLPTIMVQMGTPYEGEHVERALNKQSRLDSWNIWLVRGHMFSEQATGGEQSRET